MSYTLKVHMPNLNDGAEVEIDKLGRYANGGEYEISPEEAEAFKVSHGRTLGEAFLGSLLITAEDPDEVFPEDVLEDTDPFESMTDDDLREALSDEGKSTEGDREELVERMKEGEND